MGAEAMGISAAIIVLVLFLLIILWVLLPFLIVGTNNRLNKVITLLHENNALQEDIRADIRKLVGEAEKSLNQ